MAQTEVLKYLEKNGAVRRKKLIDMLDLTNGSFNDNIRRLKKEGLIEGVRINNELYFRLK